jgi:hypothetical protein
MIFTKDFHYEISTDSQREYTSEGYLKVPARLARCGIYKYKAGEIGIHEVPPDTILRVYRPKSEVFNKDSLKSFQGAVVTDDHPPVLVDSKNFKNYDLGVVMTKGRQNGDYVEADLLIRDADTISKIEQGKQEISSGYKARYDYQYVNGRIVAGDYKVVGTSVQCASCDYGEYDVIQKDVQINHVALVDTGRAGQEVRVFDNGLEQTKVIAMQITLDSGAKVAVTAENSEIIFAQFEQTKNQLAEQTQKCLQQQATIDSMKKSMDEKDEELDKKKAELESEKEEKESMKKKTDDAAIDQRIDTIIRTKEQCREIAGDDVTLDTNNVLELKKIALRATTDASKQSGWEDQNEAYYHYRFDFALEQARNKQNEVAVYDNQLKELVGTTDAATDEKPVLSRREQYKQQMMEVQ